MNDFMNEMIDNNLDLQDSLIESRKKQVEGIVANTDTESEETAIKKLTEEEGLEQDKPETATEEDFQDDIEEEPAEDPDEDEGVDKEYFGKTGDNSYYLVGQQSDEGSTEDLQVVDQEGEKVFSAKDNELEITDVTDFIIQAVQEMDMEDMSADMFTKYVLPRLVEPEEEEMETPEEEGMEDEETFEDEQGEEDTMIPDEEDTFESKKRKAGSKVREKKLTESIKKENVPKINERSYSYLAETPPQEEAINFLEQTLRTLHKKVVGYTTIGRSPQTVILDLTRHGSEIRINREGEVKINGIFVDPEDAENVEDALANKKSFESVQTTHKYKDKTYQVALLPKHNVSLGGKIYPLSESTLKFYNIMPGSANESDLKDLAKDMLRAMEESELKDLKESKKITKKVVEDFSMQDRRFRIWITAVDDELEAKYGINSDDLDDFNYREHFDNGMSPGTAARKAYKNANESKKQSSKKSKKTNEDMSDYIRPGRVNTHSFAPFYRKGDIVEVESYDYDQKKYVVYPRAEIYQVAQNDNGGSWDMKIKVNGRKLPQWFGDSIDKIKLLEPIDGPNPRFSKKTNEDKVNEDITADVKDLQKQAEQAVKDGDYVKAADLVNRLANVETAVGVSDEVVSDEPVSVEEPVDDVDSGVEVTFNEPEVIDANKSEEELPDDVKEQVSFLSALLDEGMYR